MGNHQHNPKILNYKELKKQSNTILGTISQIELLQIPSKMYLHKKILFNDKLQYSENLINLKKLKYALNNSINILNIVQIQQMNTQHIFTKNLEIILYLQFCQSDLMSYFLQSTIKFKKYTQSQLLKFLDAIVSGLTYAFHNNIAIAPISKKSILITPQISIKLIPYDLVDFNQQYCLINFQDHYIAPQLLLEYKKGNKVSLSISPKSQIFSTGMLMLSLAVNKSLQTFYNYYNYQYDAENILNLIDSINYSKGFKQLLKGMTQPKQNLRFGLRNLQEIINKKLQPKIKTQEKIQQKTQNKLINSIASFNSNLSTQGSTIKQLKDIRQPLSQLQSNYNLNNTTKKRIKGKIVQNKHQISATVKKQSKLEKQQKYSNETKSKTQLESQKQKELNPEKQLKQIVQQKIFKKKVFSNGAVYQGEIDQNQNFTGKGTLYYPNGQICYKGSWFNNQFSGYGLLLNEIQQIDINIQINYKNFNQNISKNVWLKYQGQFNKDLKSGYGKLYFRNGQKYSGCFIDDCISGTGIYQKIDSIKIQGYWNNNTLVYQI